MMRCLRRLLFHLDACTYKSIDFCPEPCKDLFVIWSNAGSIHGIIIIIDSVIDNNARRAVVLESTLSYFQRWPILM